jgi:hypothetical protein
VVDQPASIGIACWLDDMPWIDRFFTAGDE